jgi:hypothetical protein
MRMGAASSVCNKSRGAAYSCPIVSMPQRDKKLQQTWAHDFRTLHAWACNSRFVGMRFL